jgi:hypothetical protein
MELAAQELDYTVIENGDTFILQTVPETKTEQNTKLIKSSFTVENQELNGDLTISYTGESRQGLLSFIHTQRSDKYKEALIDFLVVYYKVCFFKQIQN